MNKHLSLYGLKFNPFLPDLPISACLVTEPVDHFAWRVQRLAREGGFALLSGDTGSGKSVALRILVDRLEREPDVRVAVLTRPQSSLADFYRELGDLFGFQLKPHNRWAGAKLLRERWRGHLDSTRCRAILVADEAQEMSPAVLAELRLLMASDLDSRALLTVVLCGDKRLPDKFRLPELVPLGSRVRARLMLDPLSPDELGLHLQHVLADAGHPALITPELQHTLCEHAAGNLRILMTMAAELLDAAIQKDKKQLDEGLYLEVYNTLVTERGRKPRQRTRA